MYLQISKENALTVVKVIMLKGVFVLLIRKQTSIVLSMGTLTRIENGITVGLTAVKKFVNIVRKATI